MDRSRYHGVYWETRVGRWAAFITDVGPPKRSLRIAHFDREEDAAVAHDRVVLFMRGASARRNFPSRTLKSASIREIRAELRQGKKLKKRTSRWNGVYLLAEAVRRKATRSWCAEVRLPTGRLSLVGRYATEKEAALAHDRATLFLRGDDGTINFPAEALRLGPASVKALRAERERVRKADTTSKYRGVSWASASGRWRAAIRAGDSPRHIGLFDDEREAALAYDAEARVLHGALAKLNFPKLPRSRHR